MKAGASSMVIMQKSRAIAGDYDYRFANDLTWSGGPGVLLALKDDYTVSLHVNCTGETKGKDTFEGEKAEDTGITSVRVALTWHM